MALRVVLGGLLLLCTLQKSSGLTQAPIEVQCKAQFLSISVNMPPSGNELRFEAIDSTGAYPVTGSYGSQCGYSYSAQPILARIVLRASYFSCHTENQNDEVFTFRFGVIIKDPSGVESYFNVSKTCSGPPFSMREVTCEENYMEVSVRTDVRCPTAVDVKSLSAAVSVAQSSAMEAWQVMMQKDGQQAIMSVKEAATLGYFIMATATRLVLRTRFGQPYASVTMVNGVSVETIKATVFFKQNMMVVMVDLIAACSLDEGSFDEHGFHWRTPAVMTPLAVGPSPLRSEYIGMGVDGELMDEQTATGQGYSVNIRDTAVASTIPFAAEGGIRRSFVMNNEYHELYAVDMAYQQMFVDQSGVKTKYNVVRQMATPPIPLSPYSINQTVPEEQAFTVYLGNIPFDVELVSVILNGQEVLVADAALMGYSIIKVQENTTFAYIIKVPFEDKLVVKQSISIGILVYILNIRWILKIMPQMDTYYHDSSVTTTVTSYSPFVFDAVCADNGISFIKTNRAYDYLWDVVIGRSLLTPQLASERGYFMTNDSTTLRLDVPLFTIGYVYEDITLQQFYGTFELLTRNSKTFVLEQSSSQRCLFQTTELLVCSTDGVMTVVSDITKTVPGVDPARTTLLDPSCRAQEMDETRVLFSFGLNTCGTRVQVDRQYVTYENEIIFHQLYSTDRQPVITRDASYRLTVMCVYPISAIESLYVDLKFSSASPGIGQIMSPVMDPPQRFMPVQQKRPYKMPSFQTPVANKPTRYGHQGRWPLGF